MDDFYDLLEVPENASHDDIKAAWREKASEYHPDVNDDERAAAQFKTLRKAYEVLSDETERSAYDRLGHANYVSKRLDGLPTAGMTRPSSGSGGNRWQTASRSTASTTGGGRSASSSGGSRSASSSSRGSAGGSSSARTASSTSTSTSSGSSTSNRSSASNRNRSSASTSSASTRSATSTRSSASSSTGTGRSSRGRSGRSSGGRTSSSRARSNGRTGDARGTEESKSTSTAADAAADEGSSRSPLWYGWTAVFLAGVGYLAGLAAYLQSNLGALSSLATAAATDPVTALSTSHGLTPAGTFVLGAVAGPPSVALAFPAGAALLAVVFTGTVAKFGRGTAYLYLAGAFAPLAALSFGTAVAVEPAGATLALLVVLPLAATLVFLGDVGRFLVSDR